MRLLALTMATKATALVKPLPSHAAISAHVPKLVDLAAQCGWDFYGPDEWQFLADAACDSGWVVEGDDGKLLGCLLRADYERANGLGMMLVSPAARGQGLGKKLMNAGLDAVPADRRACPVRLELSVGRPTSSSRRSRRPASRSRWSRSPCRSAATRCPESASSASHSCTRRLVSLHQLHKYILLQL